MRFIDIQPIYAELFKGDDIILFLFSLELSEPSFQLLFCAFKLLDRELFTPAELQFVYAFGNLINLLTEQVFLSFLRHRDTLKLAVADDHGIIIAGSDPCAELTPVGFLEILFRSHKDVR